MSKRICEHDFWEIVQFKEFLADKAKMPPAELYRKYQKYCGLSDEELAVLTVERTRKEGK